MSRRVAFSLRVLPDVVLIRDEFDPSIPTVTVTNAADLSRPRPSFGDGYFN